MMENSEEVDRIRKVYAAWEPTLDRGNPGYLRSIRERDTALKQLLREQFKHKLPRSRVLDVGCGYGSLLDLFHQEGVPAEGLFGVDIIPNRTETARERYPGFTFTNGNAENLEFPDQWFDFVTVFTVFSSILDREMAKNVARSIVRVLAADGVVVWYDMRYPNPWNSNVKVMTKSRIRELFPSLSCNSNRSTSCRRWPVIWDGSRNLPTPGLQRYQFSARTSSGCSAQSLQGRTGRLPDFLDSFTAGVARPCS